MEVIAVTNQKGGVSKTTTSHALAIEFSKLFTFSSCCLNSSIFGNLLLKELKSLF